jgi:hypothetical protein
MIDEQNPNRDITQGFSLVIDLSAKFKLASHPYIAHTLYAHAVV